MGLKDAIIITILLSQSLSEAQGRGIPGSLLQGLLSSNPQLLKMMTNRLLQTTQSPCQSQYSVIQSQKINQYPVIDSQYQVQTVQKYAPGTQYPATLKQSYPVCSSQQAQPVTATVQTPVVTTQPQQCSVQYTAQPGQQCSVQYTQQTPTQYTTVQQTQTCPSKPCPFCSPAPMVNPFLPAASPVSALCPPTSNLLPPANPTLARSQFLRKIPIPPPCL